MNEITITQTGQNQITLTSTVTSNGNKAWIYAYDATEPAITDTSEWDLQHSGDIVSVNLEDGTYIAKFYNANFTPPTQYIPLFIFGSIQECLNKLNDTLLCSDDNDHCNECNEENIKKAQYDFTKLTLLFWMIMGYINWEKVTYYNYFAWTDARGIFVTKIAKMLNKMNRIVARCHHCKEGGVE